MYVCSCKVVTDHQIKDAFAAGDRTMIELIERLGICKQCGTCGKTAKDILANLLKEHGLDKPPKATHK